MNPLIMQLKIELSKNEKLLGDLKIKISRLLNELYTFYCPIYEEIEEVKADEILSCATELKNVKQEALEVEKRVNKLKKELG